MKKHSVPISQMGNYHQILMQNPPLRTIDDESRSLKRGVFFGNPFVRSDKVCFLFLGWVWSLGLTVELMIFSIQILV